MSVGKIVANSTGKVKHYFTLKLWDFHSNPTPPRPVHFRVGKTRGIGYTIVMELKKHISSRMSTIDPELRRALIVLTLLIITGTVFYHLSEGWNYLDSLYFSVISLTTIGYGDMHPTNPITKIFTIVYVLFGVGLAFHTFTATTRHFMRTEKEELERIEHDVEHIEAMLEKQQ